MKPITILATIMGIFFGLVSLIIIAIIDSVALAIPAGILAGLLFGGLSAICMLIDSHIEDKKYARYRTQNIKEPILFEDSLFNLNGNAKNDGHLYLTRDSLIAVIIQGKTVLKEIKIPLTTIANFEKRHDYGHLANVVITQSDGTETRFTDIEKLYDHLIPLTGKDVFASTTIQKQLLLEKQHEHYHNGEKIERHQG